MNDQDTHQGTSATTPYSTVVLDIEGTTTPITFVHDVLFPYVEDNLETFLTQNWDDPECTAKIDALREQSWKDANDKVPGLVPVLTEPEHTSHQVLESVVHNVRWQMSIDRKIGPLKALQGYMWRSAYEGGKIKGAVYADVVPAFRQWADEDVDIYIYSSGSIEAQKLLFGWSEAGNLLQYFKGHFDTGVGLKTEAASYAAIAKSIEKEASSILFLSDNVREIEAAIAAGWKVAVAQRPGNAVLPGRADGDSLHLAGRALPIVRSFAEVFTRPVDFRLRAAPARFKLDDLIHLETMFEELGREDGLRDGVHAGHTEGRVAGTEAGFAMGEEAGFYAGVAETWLKAAEKGLITPSERAIKALQALRAHAREFPTINHTEASDGPDPTVALDRLRGRFKVTVSALGPDAASQRFRPEVANPPMSF
ncbi:Enolase-phosphatase E1 [Thoreauomyces humboldtii]|nr:Enolase-phosphatase E1 [Thoreauomyces humboldtii]